MIKVSVIIPVYNGELYIKSCLDSVLEQTLKEIEVIVINDNSTDNTQTILEDYKERYKEKIKIIKKEKNEGQGKARNLGIDSAQGEFLTFVDSDDTIDKNMLKKMYEKAKSQESDVVVCDYYEIVKDKRINVKTLNKRTQEIKKDYITSVAGPCNKLIKTNLMKDNNLYFLETGIYEDVAMIPLIGIVCKKITYIEEPLYNYFIRKGSTMRQDKFNEKLLSIYNALEHLENEFKRLDKYGEYEQELEFIYIKHLLYAATGRFLEYEDGKEQVNNIVQIMKSKYPNWNKNKYYLKQGVIFKLNCKIFYLNNIKIIMQFQNIKKFIKNKGK